MRVAYYYHQGRRLPPSDPNNNPYGELLCQALERRGVEVEFTLPFDEDYLRRNQGRIDILHFNWPHHDYYHDDAALMEQRMQAFVGNLELARELGYKVVWTAHNLYPHNRTHQEIDHRCRLALCRLATAVIAHCDASAAAVRQTFGRTGGLFIIPHGNFIDVYPTLYSREAARAELGIPADAFAYGFFGSIQPYKGVEALIDGVARLPGDDVWLAASGSGVEPYLGTVRARAAVHPRVILRTYRRAPSEDIALIMQAADVVTLPFVATMTSGTLMLALSWGRPVIAPGLGCLPETVSPDAGILYNPDEPDALHRALLAIRERDLRAAGEAALACARRFDWDRIATLTLEAYAA
jgi:beta-1,4-mannosyltransferase